MKDTINKYYKYIIGLFPLLTGIYYAIVRLSPEKSSDLHLSFVSSFLRHAFPEIALISMFLLIYAVIYRYDEQIQAAFQAFKQESRYKIIASLWLGTILLFLVINYKPLYSIARARVYHYRHLYTNYKYDLYGEIATNLNSLRFDLAINSIDKITKEFPNEQYELNKIKSQLDGRKRYAEVFKSAPLQSGENTETSMPLDRKEINKRLASYFIWPEKESRTALQNTRNKIEEGLLVANLFYVAAQNNDSLSCARIYKDWGWFLFESETLRLHARKYPEFDYTATRYLMYGFSKDVFIDRLKKHWMLSGINQAINWKPDIYNGINREIQKEQETL
jgi:hypothetical protein